MDDKNEIPTEVPEESAEEVNEDSQESSTLDQICGSISEDAAVDLTKEETDYVTLFDHKKEQLDMIQGDLNELMVRLNNFITDSQEDSEEEDPSCEEPPPPVEQDKSTEKQDGPQEKELLKQNTWESISAENIYVCDGLSPPEVNWEFLAPFIQNVVGDLQKIRSLNQMTNSVLQRIRNITEPKDSSTDE